MSRREGWGSAESWFVGGGVRGIMSRGEEGPRYHEAFARGV